jgi:uncharacterized protein YjbI with pentapeptide repeats
MEREEKTRQHLQSSGEGRARKAAGSRHRHTAYLPREHPSVKSEGKEEEQHALVLDGDGECREVRVVGARHGGEDFTRGRFVDVELVRCDLSGSDFSEATWDRVRVVDCRASAIELPQAALRNVAFVDCKLDDANLRMARLREVRFDNCVLAGAEFGAAQLEDVAFNGSDLAGVDFGQARCAAVDLRDARLTGIKGIDSLRGATVALEQVVTLAPALALALGLRVHTDDEPVAIPAPVAAPRLGENDRRNHPPRR